MIKAVEAKVTALAVTVAENTRRIEECVTMTLRNSLTM